jgi:F0F1-type ATP synthase assembly protein I
MALLAIALDAIRVPYDRATTSWQYALPYEEVAGLLALVSATALGASIGLLIHRFREATLIGFIVGELLCLLVR